MDNVKAMDMPQDVREELYALLDELTPQQVVEYARRVEAGEVDGKNYFSAGCGCAYGTALNIQGLNQDAIEDAMTERVKQRVAAQLEGFSPLEFYVWYITPHRDTPNSDKYAAALYAACLDYMALRQMQNGASS